MYSFGLHCGQCHSSYSIQVPSESPGPQQCVVCGSMDTEVVDYGIRHAWSAVVLAEEDEALNRAIERVREVFGPDVEEIGSAEPAAAVAS